MNNNYSSLLSELIDKSGLSLTEISQRVEKYGQKITPSYLSKLKNGKMPAPSFKISIALARTLDVDPELLLAAGFVDNKESDREELKKSLRELYPDLDNGELMVKVLNITLSPDNIVNPPNYDEMPTEEDWKELYKMEQGYTLSEPEQSLVKEDNLSLENLKGKYNFKIDGQQATDEEIDKMIEYIKIYRLMKQNDRS
ncbi:XRE family transcriptional regulator [Bacillus phage PK1]|nr:XRE family transcriptional regulator [Bacillus phage PK1]